MYVLFSFEYNYFKIYSDIKGHIHYEPTSARSFDHNLSLDGKQKNRYCFHK